MRRSHLEALRPVCPVCRSRDGRASSLVLARVAREEAGHVIEGVLHCEAAECRREYPIIDGVPILIAKLRAYLAEAPLSFLGREDLDAETESLLGDCFGPGSAYDTRRHHLSTYAWSHYSDLDPREGLEGPAPLPELVGRGLALAGEGPAGPAIDAGCAVGRGVFDIASARDGLVLGVDLNFAMLRLAARCLRRGVVRYPRKRVGLVYDRREFPVSFAGAERVDFWACDATALPFPEGTFGLAVSLNLIDCIASPIDHLRSLRDILAPGGRAIIASPYDWAASATPFEAWLGGHSQRGESGGASEPVLRSLLGGGGHPAAVPDLVLRGEVEAHPWRLRLHERSSVRYDVHLVAAERTPGAVTSQRVGEETL